MDLAAAVRTEQIVARYTKHIIVDSRSTCVFWTGAISGRGHGRFWVGPKFVVVAHRFAYALAHGPTSVRRAQVLAHTCDEPLCQNPEHLGLSTNLDNTNEWALRRQTFAGPLADPRGARGRALAIRAGLRAGSDIPDVLEAQRTELERGQLSLFTTIEEEPSLPPSR